jgi:hypothetical protein
VAETKAPGKIARRFFAFMASNSLRADHYM